MTSSDPIRRYHQRTKHRPGAYARGPEYLDWEHQPDPFRRFHEAPLQTLPLLPDDAVCAERLSLASISKLLELGMGLSAWKSYGPDRWALRCNPSSGNLHPTETYLVSHRIDGLADGVHHYAPREHALERRAALNVADTPPYCLIGLSSILWREAWKYGERAFRYVQLDVGHALAALRYAAASLGWRVQHLASSDRQIAALLGLDREADFSGAEAEHPDLLVRILPPGAAPDIAVPDARTDLRHWRGQALPLGGEPNLRWPVVEQAAEQTECAAGLASGTSVDLGLDRAAAESPYDRAGQATLIRQRRSAQAYAPKQSTIDGAAFARLLRAMLPDPTRLPWDGWPLPARIHAVLFVHRVADLAPGLYALPRRPGARELMQTAMREQFAWEPVGTLDPDIPLYRLASDDMRATARMLSCHQEIASASSFSLGMLAEFDSALKQGPCAYRHLYWEAGMIGQALYLEAEALGLRGTGIGCFYDDNVHDTLGIADTRLQSLYHFTVGRPKTDARLHTEPPYAHRQPMTDPGTDQ